MTLACTQHLIEKKSTHKHKHNHNYIKFWKQYISSQLRLLSNCNAFDETDACWRAEQTIPFWRIGRKTYTKCNRNKLIVRKLYGKHVFFVENWVDNSSSLSLSLLISFAIHWTVYCGNLFGVAQLFGRQTHTIDLALNLIRISFYSIFSERMNNWNGSMEAYYVDVYQVEHCDLRPSIKLMLRFWENVLIY